MGSIIQILNEHTINQIAAGEVIEGPSSVIKELVDNAIDAKATLITVEIKAGGCSFIRVSDNGVGMSPDDALLCFERHATSKISSISDLDTLSTMGFRGEALSSIAAISKLRLTTKPKNEKEGSLVIYHGGEIRSCSKVACEPGTTIEIHELFYNVPARLKFLKSPMQNQNEIQRMLILLALSHTHIHFIYIVDGKKVFQCPIVEGDFIHRLQKRAEQLLDLNSLLQVASPSVNGLIGFPTLHRPNRTGQMLFINQRPVISPLISQAVLEGYGTSLPEKRYPIFILHLNLSSQEIDVNVHPQKKEVRFRHEEKLKEEISHVIMNALGRQAQTLMEKIHVSNTSYPSYNHEIKMPSPICKEETLSLWENKPTVVIPHVIGYFKNFILLQSHDEHKEELCFLDAAKASARIFYEHLLKKEKKAVSQILITPIILTLNKEEHQQYMQKKSELISLGFDIHEIKGVLYINSIPNFVSENNAASMIKNLLWEEEMPKFLAYQANKLNCSSLQEAQGLLKQLFNCQQPYFSPKGEPIFAWINEKKIEALFT